MITSDQLPALISVTCSHFTNKLFIVYSLYGEDSLLDAVNDCVCHMDEATLVCPNIDTLYPEALL